MRIVRFWAEVKNITSIMEILQSEGRLMTHTTVLKWCFAVRNLAAWNTTIAEDDLQKLQQNREICGGRAVKDEVILVELQ